MRSYYWFIDSAPENACAGHNLTRTLYANTSNSFCTSAPGSTPCAPLRREKGALAPNILVKYSMDSTLDFGFRFSHFRNTNVSQNYSTSLTKHTRHLFLPFESLNHREDWKERGICHQKFPLVDVSKLRLSFVWKCTTDMFWRWNEEPKDRNYVWQCHSKIIPRSLKEKNIWALGQVKLIRSSHWFPRKGMYPKH